GAPRPTRRFLLPCACSAHEQRYGVACGQPIGPASQIEVGLAPDWLSQLGSGTGRPRAALTQPSACQSNMRPRWAAAALVSRQNCCSGDISDSALPPDSSYSTLTARR